MTHSELRIMGGTAHPELTSLIANYLEIEPLNALVGEFPDGETNVEIYDDVRDKDIFVVQPTGRPANHNIMECLIMVDALRRASAGRITAVMPYFGYARQDRKETSRKPITAKLVTNLLSGDAQTGVDRLLSLDLHADQIQGFTDLPFDHLYARYEIAKRLGAEIENPVIYAPDVGADKKARAIATLLNTNEWGVVDKDRIDDRNTNVAAIVGRSVTGRNVVIVDDVASTCGTLLSAAETLKNEGAKSVIGAVTHGVFCDTAIEDITASPALDGIYFTNSLRNNINDPKFHEIDISPLLGDSITRINQGKSLRSLFN